MKFSMSLVFKAILACGLVMSVQSVFAQVNPNNGLDTNNLDKYGVAPGNPKAAAQDRLFLNTAVQGGLAEVQLGTLATQKSGNDMVKQLGQKLVDDHTALDDMLKANAKATGVSVPDKPSKKDMAEYNKLNGLSGAEFDKEFLAYAVKDHKKDLSDYQEEDGKTPNPDLKATVDKGIQMISMHLQMAQKLAAAQ